MGVYMLTNFTLNRYEVLYDRLNTRLEVFVQVQHLLLQIFAAQFAVACTSLVRLRCRALILRELFWEDAWLWRLLMLILKLVLVLVSRSCPRPGFLQKVPEEILVRFK